MNTESPYTNTEKRYTFKQNIGLILRGYRLLNTLPKPLLLSAALSAVFEAALPFINIYFSAMILDELTGARGGGRLTFLAVLTVCLNLVATLINNALKRWQAHSDNDLTWNMIDKIYSDKMLAMDYVDAENPDVQNEFHELRRHHHGMGFGFMRMRHPLPAIVRSAIQIGLSAALTFALFTRRVPAGSPYAWLDYPLAAVVVLLVLTGPVFLAPYLNAIGGRVWAKASHDNNKGNRIFGFYFFQMIEGSATAKDIRVYDQRRLIDTQFDNDEFLNFNAKKGRSKWLIYTGYNAKYTAFGALITYLCNGLIYLFVALKALAGAFGVGGIVLYVGAVAQFGMGFSSIFSGIAELAANNPFIDKAFRFLDIPNGMYQGSLTTEKRSDLKYEIEFRNVSFKYPSSEVYALKNVSIKLDAGRRLAVVGENGSGKSTFIKLLCRLYDPTEGEILLNGIDIKKYDYGQYMDIFSIVFQDFKLLPLTLGQNVAASVAYDDRRVRTTLEQSGFGERLASLPEGLDTHLYKNFEESGVEISGGEAQKIALARALYKDAPFVILDEPTAALDPVAEYEVYSKFDEIVGNKTAVYISHRLASCRFCDDIAVFHEGALTQRGNHAALLSDRGGKYYELWNAQAQYYTSSDANSFIS